MAHPSWILTDLACAGWMVLAALLARGIGFIPSVLDPDESLYLLQAREWLRGGWPYVAVWDMHPVGAPAIVAAGLFLFGESIAAARLVGALFVAATGFLLFRTVVLARCGHAAGLAAGLLYVGYTVLPGGLATNTEILLAPFVAAGFALALVAARDLLAEGRVPGVGAVGVVGAEVELVVEGGPRRLLDERARAERTAIHPTPIDEVGMPHMPASCADHPFGQGPSSRVVGREIW